MMAGLPLGSQAIGHAGRRALSSEWGGPETVASRGPEKDLKAKPEAERRVAIRKP